MTSRSPGVEPVSVLKESEGYVPFWHRSDQSQVIISASNSDIDLLTMNMDAARHSTTYIHTYSFTDPSSAQVGLNVEFIMRRT